jgi:hypothetical protein
MEQKGYNLRSGISRSTEGYICTDVSGQLIGPIFKSQEVYLGQPIGPIFKGQEDFLTLEDGTDMLSRNVGTDIPLNAA